MPVVTDREFLVRIVIDATGVDDASLASLREAEARRAAEFAADGTLRRLWRLSAGWSNCGVWSAPSEQVLRKRLATLPLHPWMTIEIEKLSPHPSDPAVDSTSVGGSA